MGDPPVPVKSLAAFLIRHHFDQLSSITHSPDPKLHYPLFINFTKLLQDDPPLARLVFSQPTEYLRFFDVGIDVCGSPLECAGNLCLFNFSLSFLCVFAVVELLLVVDTRFHEY
ncbi:hypothetical protein L484_026525 [Morus notabilis]|uniref:MCM9 N-terminal domain-containing protein n=1 Tax=Morus notabilis TaxID=981085 RepID=W9RAS5_9ROSA|nr:hypothetical protein L484_026525 [Morus notabilis]